MTCFLLPFRLVPVLPSRCATCVFSPRDCVNKAAGRRRLCHPPLLYADPTTFSATRSPDAVSALTKPPMREPCPLAARAVMTSPESHATTTAPEPSPAGDLSLSPSADTAHSIAGNRSTASVAQPPRPGAIRPMAEERHDKAKTAGSSLSQTTTKPAGKSGEPPAAAPFANGYHFPPKHSLGQSTRLACVAFWNYFRTPLGFMVTIYGLNVVAWGGMLFLLLCNAGRCSQALRR